MSEDEIIVVEDDDTTEITTLESDGTEEVVTLAEDIPSYDKNYLHIQSVPSNEWNIIHNLNKYPSVSVFDSAGNEVIGDVQYTSLQQLTIKFSGEFAGKATLN